MCERKMGRITGIYFLSTTLEHHDFFRNSHLHPAYWVTGMVQSSKADAVKLLANHQPSRRACLHGLARSVKCECFCQSVFDSSVSLPLLPISSTSHLLFYLVTLPISLLLGLLNRIISVRHFLFAQPFVLFEFISQSDSHSSIFPSLALFFFTIPLPLSFLVCVTLHHHFIPPPPPSFSLSRERCYQK